MRRHSSKPSPRGRGPSAYPNAIRRARSDSVVTFRPADLFAISVPLLFGLVIALNARRVPDWAAVSGALVGAALLGVACRLWAAASASRLAQFAGSFYVIVTLWTTYSRLNPLIDLVSPVPYDRDLQAIDAFLFGVQPSVWLEQFQRPWLTEILFIAYALFFFWQLALGILLFLRRDRHALADYLLTVLMFYMLSYVSYVFVPAIGPRFDLAPFYTQELHGLWLADDIRRSFLHIPMLRDCFPSGHTGLTILVLFHAYKSRARVFFWIMLPCAMLLIFSTVYCRFHYAIDLLCALPFITGILLLKRALLLTVPAPVRLATPRPALTADPIPSRDQLGARQ